jgi:hypothetical protein
MTIFVHAAKGILPAGESFQFGLHTEKAAGVLADAHTAWADAIDLLWNGVASPADSIKQLYPSTISVVELVTTQLDALTFRSALQATTGVSLVGTGSGDALPQEVAVRVTTRTAIPRQRGRGGFDLPSPILTACVGSLLSSTARGQIAAAAEGMLGSLAASTYQPVIFHTDDHTTDDIIKGDVGNVFDVRISRKRQLVEVRSTFTV